MKQVPNLEMQRFKIADLHLHPHNPRQGDIGAIMTSMKAHGIYAPIVVQSATMNVIKGNHTMQAAHNLGYEEIDAIMLDVDDDQALRILLADNQVGDQATNDLAVLVDLLEALMQSEYTLEGTGFTGDDLDELLMTMNPEWEQESKDSAPIDLTTHYQVVIICETEDEQASLLERFINEGLTVKGLII